MHRLARANQLIQNVFGQVRAVSGGVVCARADLVVALTLTLTFGIAIQVLGQSPVATGAPSAETRFFEIDNEHSSLLFAVSHAGLSYTYGRFEKCSGQVILNANPEDSQFHFEIEVASINTNSRLRDDHLRGGEFFDVKKYPKINFTSTSVKIDGGTGNYIVTGKMLMHGAERAVEMPITLIGVGEGPLGKTRGGFMTKFNIKRSDFGMDTMQKVIGDQIAITFSFEGILGDTPDKILTRALPQSEK